MTFYLKILDPREIRAADAQASLFMQEGIHRLQTENDVEAALRYFDRALELRRRLPIELPIHAYGLAACWLNRAEALTRLGADYYTLTLCAYDEALALLRPLPLDEEARFCKRLAIAHQNKALVLAAHNPPKTAEAIASLVDAIAVLDHGEAMDAPERDYLLAVVWMNLANLYSSEDMIVSDSAAQEAAERAVALVKPREHENAAAAEVGLKARHVLCRIVARRLSARPQSETVMTEVHDATDLSDEGLDLICEWERQGVDQFRNLAYDLFRFGKQVYADYQAHFLHEFLNEQLDPRQSSLSYVQSLAMQDVALASV